MLALARAALAAPFVLALAGPPPAAASDSGSPTPADAVVAAVDDPALATVLLEVLERNPSLAVLRERATAADRMAPQERPLPDPWLELSAFPLSPDESQVGVSVRQEIPGRGKRRLAAEAATHDAAAEHAMLQAERLALVTEAREMWLEIAFVDEALKVLRAERATLEHFEGLARARYAAGEGMQQDVVKLQAEVTRVDVELVRMESERLTMLISLNALRGRPGSLEAVAPRLPEAPAEVPGAARLAAMAEGLRPEIAEAAARVAAATTRADLAQREKSPDFMVSGAWTFMGSGMDMTKEGPENDEAMVGVGIRLPVHGGRIRAAIEQAAHEREAALHGRDAVALAIARDAALATSRHALTLRQLRLAEDVLAVQAEEALRSAEAAYATGIASSLELLDAERELFEIRLSATRARADLAILVARLEGTLGAPLSVLGSAAEVTP